MTTYIKHPGRIEWVEYRRDFDYANHPGSGLSFEVDKDGALIDPTPQREAYLAEALTGVVNGMTVIDLGVIPRERSYWESGSLRCQCGREHFLARGDSACECGQYYNACGQRLNPPHMWDDIDHQP